MRDRTAIAVLCVILGVAGIGIWFQTADLPAEETPEASFEVTYNNGDELIVEHREGTSLASGSIRILVYEERPIVPDRTVHGTIWETETGVIQPGARIQLADPRFESDQRLVVRWFGEDGQANLYETRL